MLQTSFIYHPRSIDRVFRSADRVFAQNIQPAAGIRVVMWQNGCRHVQGGVRLEYDVPGKLRYRMRELASRIIDASGGIAWDHRRIISLVLPAAYGWAAHTAIATLLAAPLRPNTAADDPNIVQLVAAGVAWLVPEEGKLVAHPIPYGMLEEGLGECLPKDRLPRYKEELPLEVLGVQPIDHRDYSCPYCGADVARFAHPDAGEQLPPTEDVETWGVIATQHVDGCEWIATRAPITRSVA